MSMESMVERLVAQMAKLSQEVARAQVRARQAEDRVAALEAHLARGGTHETFHKGASPVPPADAPGRVSRQGFLKAVTAGAVGLTAMSLAIPERAGAATGDPLLVGEANTAISATRLGGGATRAWEVTAALQGEGVVGVANGSRGYGVYGLSDSGYAVRGNSASGISLMAAGSGRLCQMLRSEAGPPTSGSFAAGEQLRDANGDLYLCVEGGSPGAWRTVHAFAPEEGAGALRFLPAPVRLLDTRLGAGTPVAAGGTHTLQVTGADVPAGAKGVVGNVTVVAPGAAGYLTVYPAGAARPLASTANYLAGQVLNTPFSGGLDGLGRLDLYTVAHTHLVVDAVAFVR